jgi:hypothetical protein
MQPRSKIDHDIVLNLWSAGFTSGQIATLLRLRRPEAVRNIVQRSRELGDQRAKVRTPSYRAVYELEPA